MAHKHHQNPSHDSAGSRMGTAFFLNACFTLIELVGGWLTNSTAIMADAVHDLGDTLSIGLGWLLQILSRKGADERFSYGYRRFSLLGAVINAAILIAGSLLILSEAVPRLWSPEMPHAQGMLGLALLGILVNGAAAWRLSSGKSLNERVLNLHLMEDVLGWVVVLIVSLVLMVHPLPVLDPLISIGFTLFILWRVLQTLRHAISVFLQSVPDPTMRNAIRERLLSLDPVADVHHLHLWSLDGEHHVLTAHLNLNQDLQPERLIELKCRVERELNGYPLEHTTIEIEFPSEHCRDQY